MSGVGMVSLDSLLGGGNRSSASAVSADGLVIVGISESDTKIEAFRWTMSGGMLGLGDLPGRSFESRANDVSADGSVIVGVSKSINGEEAFRWTPSDGMVGLGALDTGSFSSEAYGVSANGLVIVGYSSSTTASGFEAFRWTAASGMVGMGDLAGGVYSQANAVSEDGSVVVGSAASGPSSVGAFIWTPGQGMRLLSDVLTLDHNLGPSLAGWSLREATGISDDGRVIVGWGYHSGVPEVFYANLRETTLVPTITGLGDLPGRRFSSSALDVSADGKTVVGASEGEVGEEAFRWTSATGLVGLGDLAGGPTQSRAEGVSSDGSTVVGYSVVAEGVEAFRWTLAGGMTGLGDLPGGRFFSRAFDVSADGNVVVGSGRVDDAIGSEGFLWGSSTLSVGKDGWYGQLPGDEIEHGDHVDTASVAPGFALNRAEDAIEAFHETGRQARFPVCQDALETCLNGVS